MKRLLLLLTVSIISCVSVAASLPEPSGRVLLTLSGKISNTQGGSVAKFDLEQLKQLKSSTFKLQTRWNDEPHEFHGPFLSAILEKVGATGSTLRLTALNDYTIDIERDFIEKYQPILAWRDNGRMMSVRNKGPLWLLLRHDLYDELNSENNTGKMIWQLHKIEIR